MHRDGLKPIEAMSIGDIEALRVILRGGSVIDWRRLWFESRDEVDRFLRLNLFDLEDPRDERRLRAILAQAVEYLRTAFGYRVADPVANPADVRDLFLLASGAAEPRKYRRIACIVVKCMHVVHHLEARELIFRTAVREADLAERARERVSILLAEAKARGAPIVEFSGNFKTRSSLITKLLAKRESVAAQIFDRVRFRVVTENREQITPVLLHLAETLFPFNYCVPGQTQNTLLKFREIVAAHPRATAIAGELHAPLDLESREPGSMNEFSGKGYRVLNFVVDLPVRIDEFMKPGDEAIADELGRVVFQLVELQLVDAATNRTNDEGDSSHERYKRRQLQKVLRRLSRGLVVPKRRAGRTRE